MIGHSMVLKPRHPELNIEVWKCTNWRCKIISNVKRLIGCLQGYLEIVSRLGRCWWLRENGENVRLETRGKRRLVIQFGQRFQCPIITSIPLYLLTVWHV